MHICFALTTLPVCLAAALTAPGILSQARSQVPSPVTSQVVDRDPVWVGTTDGVIRRFELGATGKLRLLARVEGPKSLRFLAFHPRLPVIYGAVGRGVQVYRVGEDTITPGRSRDAGVGGTHLEVDPSGRFVFLASYGGGAVVAFPLDEKGEPGPRGFELRAPKELCRKAHQVRAHPSVPFVYVPCLGDDALQILRIGKGGVEWRGRVRLATGSGPRHMDFHPDGKRLYVLNETASSVYAFRIEPTSGALTEVQSLSALPDGREKGSRSSDIHVSRDGRFVYAVHREPLDQIVALRVTGDGRLSVAGRTKTGGTHSRCFALTGDGRFVVLAHSKTENVIVRRIDPKTGVVGGVADEQDVGAAAIFVGIKAVR
jgi:6-phosphogluconolactonase